LSAVEDAGEITSFGGYFGPFFLFLQIGFDSTR